MSSDFHVDSIILAIHAISVAATRVVAKLLYLCNEVIQGEIIFLVSRVQLNVVHLEANLLLAIGLQNMNTLIKLLVVNEGTTYLLQVVVTQGLGKSDPNIRHTVVHQRKEVKFEILLE